MFFHIFKYRVIGLFHDKLTLFWMFLFPLILSTMFYFVIPRDTDTLVTEIPVVVNGATEEFSTTLTESGMFKVIEPADKTAEEMLKNGDIYAIISCGDPLTMEIKENGIYSTIIKTFLDTYAERTATYTNIIASNPEVMTNGALHKEYASFTKETPISGNNDSYALYFYSVLAMTAIMVGSLAIDDIEKIQANQSPTAARNNVAPAHKLKLFVANSLATTLFHFTSTMILILFLMFVYKIDFGDNLGLIVLLMFVSTWTGVMLGSLISALVKAKTSVKLAIILGYSILGANFSGMTYGGLRYLTLTKAPVLFYTMPPCLVTDGMYSLYYYDTLDRYIGNLLIILGIGVVSCIGTFLVLRRQKYASV